MEAGLETFNQQPCSPESCHSVTLAKVLLFVKAAPFFAKKITAAISFSGPYTHWLFGLQEVVLPVAWNVSYINVFIPAWMVPPVYHSLRREKIKCRNSRTAMGVKSLRPTWFEDETVAKTAAEPMHGLCLIIKEDVLPLSNHP